MILWRISEFVTLDGRGGMVVDGRWHRRGRPIVYLAEMGSLAILEARAHIEADVPETFQLLKVEAPDDLAIHQWTDHGDVRERNRTQDWGSRWLGSGGSALARVPSVIAPAEFNILLNPLHRDAERVKIVEARRWPWDDRLFR